MLTHEAIRRAHDGVERMVFYKGEPVMYAGKPLSSESTRTRS